MSGLVVDELDVFNATVTLAMARVARLPFKASPQLASEISILANLAAVQDRHPEAEAFNWVFGRSAKSIFKVYLRFWELFRHAPGPAGSRLVVNAPAGAIAPTPGQLEARFDPRLGSLVSFPERWAVPTEDVTGYVNDVTLFSEDGFTIEAATRLVNFVGPGTTVTFVRPAEHCQFWFGSCGVHHDFTTFMNMLGGRVELEPIHRSSERDPIMVTVLGATKLKA